MLQFTDSCCPAKPDSLEFCFAKLHTGNSWSLHLRKLPSQTATPFGRTAGREYGVDIRYIAPWKKWVVWDDTHWQVDTGALLYTKQLEMVRNIYIELYKTADYRDRQDIEKYAIHRT
jgi:hypothetical protein